MASNGSGTDVSAVMSEHAENVKLAANESLEDLKQTAAMVDEKVREFASERPLLALGGALAAGYLLARLMTKR